MNISPLSSSPTPPAPSAMSICPSRRANDADGFSLADCQIDTFQNMNGCRGTSQGEIAFRSSMMVFVTRRDPYIAGEDIIAGEDFGISVRRFSGTATI